jgi:MFS family permease
MATVAPLPLSVMTREQRVNQRNAVLAGFLGWTLDAFDFFVLTFVIQDVATAFGKTRPDIALTVSLALITRPIGAVVFGLMADRYGRRLPLMLNVIFYAVISVLSVSPRTIRPSSCSACCSDRHGRRVGCRRRWRSSPRLSCAGCCQLLRSRAATCSRAGVSSGLRCRFTRRTPMRGA